MVTIQQNTRVRVADVNVGNVTGIEVRDWHALVTMRIDGDVHLPANSTAKVGQTSLLGSQHIELAAPTGEARRANSRTARGSRCPGRAPTPPPSRPSPRCRCCSTVAAWANSRRSTRHSPPRWSGREDDMKSLLVQLDTFISQLNGQTDDIIAATENLNSLAGQFAAKDQAVDKALTTIPQALAVLADSRTKLANAIDALGKFGAIAADTVHQSKDALVDNLRNIAPVLRELADAGRR